MQGSKTAPLGWGSKFLLYSFWNLSLPRILGLDLHRQQGIVACRTLRKAQVPSANQRITQINIKFFYLK
jgi:hypothetical protein